MSESMTTQIVKTLRFPGNTNTQFQINAAQLGGKSAEDILQRLETLESIDAFHYRGTITASEEPGQSVPSEFPYAVGDVLRVIGTGYVFDAIVDNSDILICNTGYDTSTGSMSDRQYWDVIDTNVDVESLLDHKHTVVLDETMNPAHEVSLNRVNLSTSVAGNVSVTGSHSHALSGTVNMNLPTSVESGAPENIVNVNMGQYTPSGSVGSHKHNVSISSTSEEIEVFKSLSAECDDNGVLTITADTEKVTLIKTVSIGEEKEVTPTFTGTTIDLIGSFEGSLLQHTHSLDIEEQSVEISGGATLDSEITLTGGVDNILVNITPEPSETGNFVTGVTISDHKSVENKDISGHTGIGERLQK